MIQHSKNDIVESLKKVAEEASLLYTDKPLDYKGRRVTAEGVLGMGRSPHCVEVIEGTAANASGPKTLDLDIAYVIYYVVLKRLFNQEVCGIEHRHNISVYARFPIQQEIPVRPCDLHGDPLPFEKETFDTLIALEIVEHLYISPRALFSKALPVMTLGGRLVVTTPNLLSLRKVFILLKGMNPAAPFPDDVLSVDGTMNDPRVHPREYNQKEIRKSLVASGFKIVSMRTVVDVAFSKVSFRSGIMRTLMRLTPGRGDRIVAIGKKE
jgi:SAM-dependent methyltransferase